MEVAKCFKIKENKEYFMENKKVGKVVFKNSRYLNQTGKLTQAQNPV